MTDLFHYTCDHGRKAIGDAGLVEPGARLMIQRDDLPWPAYFAWFTDLATPLREALGLTSNYIACDRTVHRYRVTDTADIQPWSVVAHDMPREKRDLLEMAPGARPRHWFVTRGSVPVEYAPVSGLLPTTASTQETP